MLDDCEIAAPNDPLAGDFTLASGKKAKYYLDGKQVTLDGEVAVDELANLHDLGIGQTLPDSPVLLPQVGDVVWFGAGGDDLGGQIVGPLGGGGEAEPAGIGGECGEDGGGDVGCDFDAEVSGHGDQGDDVLGYGFG